MQDSDLDIMARELMRALRGPRSQRQISRRMGYSTNVAYTWEAGTRSPRTTEMLRLANLAGVDVQRAVASFLRVDPPWLRELAEPTPAVVCALLQAVRGQARIGALAEVAGVSRFSLSRWLSGRAEPRLPDFLRVVEAATLRSADLLVALVGTEALPSAAARLAELDARRDTAWRIPWSHALLRALELQAYQQLPAHLPGWLGKRLGISRVEEAACLEALEQAGLVVWEVDRYRVREVTVDTGPAPAHHRRALKLHWHDQTRRHLAGDAEGLFSYNLFTVSRDDLQRLRRAHVAYFEEVRRIVAASTPAEHVVLMQLQLFELQTVDPR